jgi:hypothetical protein
LADWNTPLTLLALDGTDTNDQPEK